MIPKEELNLIEVSLERDTNCNVVLKLKGQNRFGSLAFVNTDTITIAGVECFKPVNQKLDGVNALFYADTCLEVDNYPNFITILAKDLEKGVEFNFGKHPISEEKMVKFIEMFKEQVMILYLSYLKPINVKALVTTQTVEMREHA